MIGGAILPLSLRKVGAFVHGLLVVKHAIMTTSFS